ncbi:methyltransferase domain-containing protein [Glycomyces sp. NPDC046736]|uniref:methyltransferase domain-containing protein n=1 Tax=Glycomyces sp. NPDC046736 TaxID=3155615 RepID=UPI0033F96449
MELDKTAEPFRHDMVAGLIADGHIVSPQWRAAFAAVPRHVFLPYFFNLDNAGMWEPVTVETADEATWLGQIYSNRTCVTQINGDTTPVDVQSAVTGAATSSSTEPGLMADLLEALELDDGMSVIEIGTGTGYNAALLCERLGADNVTSIEIDPNVSEQAASRLRKTGYSPRLLVGDGANTDGLKADRLIATCSFPTVPDAWLDLVKPGGIIITTIYTRPLGMSILKLRVGDGRANGAFIVPGSGFMETRQQPRRGPVRFPAPEEIKAAAARPSGWTPADLEDFVIGFLAGWVLGDASYYLADDETPTMIIDHASDSWVAFEIEGEQSLVREGGKRRVWQAVEQILTAWQRNGDRDLSGFRYEIVGGQGGHDAISSPGIGVKWQRFRSE